MGPSRGRMGTGRIQPTTSERGEGKMEASCLKMYFIACVCEHAWTPPLTHGSAFSPPLLPRANAPSGHTSPFLLPVLVQTFLPACLL